MKKAFLFFSLPKLLSVSSPPKWENSFLVHLKMVMDGMALQARLTLWGHDVDDHVRAELWAAGAAVAQGDSLCLHLLAPCEQRSLHPSLCNFCSV